MNPAQHAGAPDHEGRRRWRRLQSGIVGAASLLGVGLLLSSRYAPNRPVEYEAIEEHFKYGSIGGDTVNGLPLRVVEMLPRLFPEHLPPGPPDYRALGFIHEPGRVMPIGFSVRRRGIDLVGLNCAVCHVGSVRASPEATTVHYLAMPANTVDLQGYFNFLFRCVTDPRFTADRVLAELEKDVALFPIERSLYRASIEQMKAGVAARQRAATGFMFPDHPRFGPGRVDTFNPYKSGQFAAYYKDGIPDEERIGTVDFPSVWNQGSREGMHLHWDGNNTSVSERNVSAAFGAGATREDVDLPRIYRIKRWLDGLPAPAFPFKQSADPAQLERGKALFEKRCASCHAFGGAYVGKVVPIDEIGTDEHRLNSYTTKLQQIQLAYGKGYDWEFKHFQKTDGYANQPLDGIWARAPYLHNGSVPTMWDLLTPAERRPRRFYRGHDVYDPVRLGFRTDVREIEGRPAFLFDTALPGNSSKGHTGERYGTELPDSDKWALIEYLKTL
ncbi:c-type cytochrome [Sorangium sp. So ce1000]|uniref:c-type cytochrome n=1 Tax=Sorangium sp. So ce1000 TaxID=3133325 RepID=UPI003F6099BB